MVSETTTISNKDRLEAQAFAQFFRAYMEASDDAQSVVREMALIANDSEVSQDESNAAIDTLLEALLPSHDHNDELGIDITDLREVQPGESEACREFEQMDREDQAFAERLASQMKAKDVSQAELASRLNVGQPAISMMLSRKCHPQRRTVAKIASALDVPPDDLWPGYSGEV